MEPNCTLIFVIDKNENILLLNRENEPAKGTWCGIGGNIEKDETIYDCAKRELHEETGIKTNKLKLLGKYDKIESYIFSIISLLHSLISLFIKIPDMLKLLAS